MTIQVVVEIEGGLVQAVYVNNKAVAKVAIVDYDVDVTDAELKVNVYGSEFYSRYESTILDNEYTDKIFEQLDNE